MLSYLPEEVYDSVVVHGEVEEAWSKDQGEVGPSLGGGIRVGNHLLGCESIAANRDREVWPVSLRRNLSRQPYKLCFLILRQGDGLAIGTSQDD